MNNFLRFIIILLLPAILTGCASVSQPKIDDITDLGEDMVEGSLSTMSVTADAARQVTSQAGSLTEGMLVVSTDFVKLVILSADKIRAKGTEVVTTKKGKRMERVMIPCPYCGKKVDVGSPTAKKSRNRVKCPHCNNEFLINYVNDEE